jgi:Calcineurin-like phosphoesterase
MRVAQSVMGALALDDPPQTQPEPGPGSPRPRLADPDRILVAGDWHTDRMWAVNTILDQVPRHLAGEAQRIILQLGNLGVWPGFEGAQFLAAVSQALTITDAELWFVDGNHEDHTRLSKYLQNWKNSGDLADCYVTERVLWLPRGYRWEWHGRTWLAAGGGVSLDKAGRAEGVSWWPGEELSDAQAAAIVADGPADVLVSHDCPSGVVHAFPDPPNWWDPADITRAEQHGQRLQRVVDDLQPAHIMHGHLHRGYQRTADFGYGTVTVTGLAENGTGLNFAPLDIRSMKWGAPGGLSTPMPS